MANGKSPLKILGPEIIGLVIVFALILGVLNYFNILSLSQIYPNLFGSLPQRLQDQEKLLVSPVKKESIIEIKESQGKLFYYLKDNSLLYPSIDGILGQGGGIYGKYNQSFQLLWLTNSTGEKLEYRYIGKLIDFPTTVISKNSNMALAQIGTQKLKALQNASLVLTLYSKNGDIKPLFIKDLEPRK